MLVLVASFVRGCGKVEDLPDIDRMSGAVHNIPSSLIGVSFERMMCRFHWDIRLPTILRCRGIGPPAMGPDMIVFSGIRSAK